MNRCKECGSLVKAFEPHNPVYHIKHIESGAIYKSKDLSELQHLVKSLDHEYDEYKCSEHGLGFTNWSLSDELAKKGIIIPKDLNGALKRQWLKLEMEMQK